MTFDIKLTSAFEMLLRVLDRIESRFSIVNALKWLDDYRWLSVCASVLYLLLLYVGQRWMRDKPAYKLRHVLVAWNAGLAVFSMVGASHLLPPLLESFRRGGIARSVCYWPLLDSPPFGLWVFLFILSKVVELGDTAFIVLRKTPLTFLHWYHHVSTLLYAWNSLPSRPGIGNWFGGMNFFVHSVMYSYFTLKACRYNVPSWVAQCITSLQLSQFIFGLYGNLLAFSIKNSGEECMLTDNVFYFGMVLYGSYALLFLNYFYHRYIKKK